MGIKEKYLWEILVPTQWNDDKRKHKPIRTRHHRVWDHHVRKISGGMTILSPAKGQWLSQKGEMFDEKMIPVRIMCTEEEIELVADMTAKHYKQKAVMFYRISDKVKIKNYE